MDLTDLTFYINEFSLRRDLLDILLVTAVIYGVLMLVQDTRAIQLVRGLLVVALFLLSINALFDVPLRAFGSLISGIFPALLFAIPVIFQPELRRAIDKLGSVGGILRLLSRQEENETLINAVSEACRRLSVRRHGALIVIERETGLQEYIDTGVPLDAMPSYQLFLTIFQKDTELHDGAVIIRDGKLTAASCIMPLSASLQSDRKMGLRHRAALGTSEVSDAVAIIVSEETGNISIAHNGQMFRRRNPNQLEDTLRVFLDNSRRTEAN